MSLLSKDIKEFLNIYHKFKSFKPDEFDGLVLHGEIDIVDEKKEFWSTYKVLILIKSSYPNTIPSVIEISEIIERDWDFHISKEGICCLDISHDLILKSNAGINITNFYRKVIYPFFANHQYKIKEDEYANGEYKHHEEGVIQYYDSTLGLTNHLFIIKLLKKAIDGKKSEPNKACPICSKTKYKKCCRPIINKLNLYGKERLIRDLSIFEKALNKSTIRTS
jgi:hypothetical protein